MSRYAATHQPEPFEPHWHAPPPPRAAAAATLVTPTHTENA